MLFCYITTNVFSFRSWSWIDNHKDDKVLCFKETNVFYLFLYPPFPPGDAYWQFLTITKYKQNIEDTNIIHRNEKLFYRHLIKV